MRLSNELKESVDRVSQVFQLRKQIKNLWEVINLARDFSGEALAYRQLLIRSLEKNHDLGELLSPSVRNQLSKHEREMDRVYAKFDKELKKAPKPFKDKSWTDLL
jgi:hypothetical protein